MQKSWLKILLGAVAIIALLALLRFKPWQRTGTEGQRDLVATEAREQLPVGFLPVT